MTKKFTGQRVDANGNVLANGHADKLGQSSSSTSSGIIVNGKVQANDHSVVPSSLDASTSSVTETAGPKQKLPSIPMNPAFKNNVSSSEPNLAATADLRWPFPTLRLSNSPSAASVPDDMHDYRPAFLTDNPFFFEHETLATVVQLPHTLPNYPPAVPAVPAVPSGRVSHTPTKPLSADKLELPIKNSLLEELAAVDQLDAAIDLDEVLQLDYDSDTESVATQSPPLRVHHYEIEMQVQVQPRVSSLRLETPTPDSRSRKSVKSNKEKHKKPVKRFAALLEEAPNSFENEIDTFHLAPRRMKVSRMLASKQQVDVGLEYEPESMFDTSVKAHAHRPRATVVFPAPLEQESKKSRRKKSQLVLPLGEDQETLERRMVETTYCNPLPMRPLPHLAIHVIKPLPDDSPCLLLLPAPGNGHAATLLQEMQILLDAPDHPDPSAAAFRDELIEQSLPFLKTKNALYSKGDGVEILHLVCPPHLAPVVDDEVLCRRYFSDEELEDAIFTNMKRRHDTGPYTHEFHYAFIPFSLYREWARRTPELNSVNQKPIVLTEHLAQFTDPPLQRLFYAQLSQLEPLATVFFMPTNQKFTARITVQEAVHLATASCLRQRILEAPKPKETIKVALPSPSISMARPRILETPDMEDTIRLESPTPSFSLARPRILETPEMEDTIRVESPTPSFSLARPRTLETVKVAEAVRVQSPAPSISSARPRVLETVKVEEAARVQSPTPSISSARPRVLETVKVEEAARVQSPAPSISSARPRVLETVKVEEATRVQSPTPSISSARPRVPEAAKVDLPGPSSPAQLHNFGAPKVEENVKVALSAPRVAAVATASTATATATTATATTATATTATTQRAPIVARVADRAADRHQPSVAPPKAHFVVVSFNNQQWNPYYRQSHGLVKECGIGTDDTDDLENFEIDANVIDALIDDSDSDDDGDFLDLMGNDRDCATATD